MKMALRASLACVWAVLLAAPGWAQECGQTYRIVYKTVYDQEHVTAYRWTYETVLEEKQVTVQRPVWEEELRERRYRVARPVIETAEREERYTVRKPIWETEYREEAFDRTTYVTETQTREERHLVQRPVWEDQVREESYVVQRPVTETQVQEQQYTTYEPQVSYHTQYVDQGQYVNNYAYQPGATRNRLAWLPGSYSPDPASGSAVWHRGGMHWVPLQLPGTYQVQKQYVPNVVAQQVPVTQYVAKVVTQQVPLQVTRYQNEVVKQQIPVKVFRMETTEEVRQVPFTVQKPVTEHIVNQVPVQVCKWVEEEVVRKVPITTQRMEYEERSEPIRVKTLRYQTEVRRVQEPHTVGKWVPYQATRLTPRTVVMRIPLDDFGNAIVAPTTTNYPPVTATIPKKTVLKKVAPVGPEMSDDMKQDARGASQSEAAAKNTDAGEPKDSDPTGKPKIDANKLELNKPADGEEKPGADGKKEATKSSFSRTRSA